MSETLTAPRPEEEGFEFPEPVEVEEYTFVEEEPVEPTDDVVEEVADEPVEPEAAEPEVAAEPAPRTHRGRRAKAAEAAEAAETAALEVTEPEQGEAEIEAVEPEHDAETEQAEPVAEEAAVRQVGEEDEDDDETQPIAATVATRGLGSWISARRADWAARGQARQEQRRQDEIARQHAVNELALAREAASRLPADANADQLRDEIAAIREERAVAAQKTEDLARADQLEAEARQAFEVADDHVRVYEVARRMHEQALVIAEGASVQMAAARQGYNSLVEHAAGLRQQAADIRAQYAQAADETEADVA